MLSHNETRHTIINLQSNKSAVFHHDSEIIKLLLFWGYQTYVSW